MPLANLQAGFRDLVRAPGASARAPRQRTRILRRVRGLKTGDRAALQRIPAGRLAIYHDLVVGSHVALSGYVFGSTFALLGVLERTRPALVKAASPREIVEAFIAQDLARTHSLRELAGRLAALLRKRYARAFRKIPLLAELLRFERVRLDVDLMEDGPGDPATEGRLRELAGRTVGDLLQTRVLVPSHLRILRLKHDPGAVVAGIAANRDGVTLEELARPSAGVIVLTRHPGTLAPVSQTVPSSAARDLSRFEAGVSFPLEQLAQARHARGPRGETEEEALNRVLSEIFGWLGGGLLWFAPAAPDQAVTPSRRRAATRRPRTGR